MSTFDGVIREFPEIRVDFFRGIADNPPLACFLSHIHSDHLAGLDTYRGRPVYCSAATRAMLLKLQRRSSRINFHQGLLEKEDITYRHQKRRLKALPLETPTEIELEPGNTIRVTLFDANHCPGAVMFLFENNSRAALYTGDIRSEPWHVNALARSPCMVEYSSGLKTLDRVYLDTSFTEDVVFQSKAEGLRELIDKVSKYSKETTFHFSAWTYGYEEVWIALAKALNTRIHVDDYKLNMYNALQVKVDDDQYLHLSPEAPALTGFTCGNRFQHGLLTNDETVRLHSCEKGTQCSAMAEAGVIFITPIVAHVSTTSDMVEVGIGGGAGDLERKEELILGPDDARSLFQSVREKKDLPQDVKDTLRDFLLGAASVQHPITIRLSRPGNAENEDNGLTDLQRAFRCLSNASGKGRGKEMAAALPNKIKFPYSRHSSYRELCHLLQVLKPKDVWPCTVDPVRWIKEGLTVDGLFGDYCAGNIFQHDEHMVELARTLNIQDLDHDQSQTPADSVVREESHEPDEQAQASLENAPAPAPPEEITSSQASTASLSSVDHEVSDRPQDQEAAEHEQPIIDLTLGDSDTDGSQKTATQRTTSAPAKRTHIEFVEDSHTRLDNLDGDQMTGERSLEDTADLIDSQESFVSAGTLETRRLAFNAVMDASNLCGWPGLLSTTNNHTLPESELGEG